MTLNDPAARFWNSLGSQRYDVGPAHAQAGRRTSDDGKILWLDRYRVSAGHAGWQNDPASSRLGSSLHSRSNAKDSRPAHYLWNQSVRATATACDDVDNGLVYWHK